MDDHIKIYRCFTSLRELEMDTTSVYMDNLSSPLCLSDWKPKPIGLGQTYQSLSLISRQPTATANSLTSPKKWQMNIDWLDDKDMRGERERKDEA